ncbi:MAG: SCO family protein [Actinomycetota bacterium]
MLSSSARTTFRIFLFAATIALISGCSHQTEKRYSLSGTVISIDSARGDLTVSHDAVAGLMPAMTMEYAVKDPSDLKQVHLYDKISANLVISGDHSRLENIRVTARGPAQPDEPVAANASFHMPEPGEHVPAFKLMDEHGRTFSLADLRGHPLAITFIYSRCPLPDYCPRMNHNFAELLKSQSSNESARDLRLLTISFDPEHDTPSVLRLMHAQWDHGADANHWTFAVVPKRSLAETLHWFGLTALPEQGVITHSLSTTLVAPDGKVIEWWHGNSWTPQDLMAAWSHYPEMKVASKH